MTKHKSISSNKLNQIAKSNKNSEELKSNEIDNEKVQSEIRNYIELDDWKKIEKIIKDGQYTDLNKDFANGNTLFHLSCIRGKTKFIKEMIKLKKEDKIKLNTNLLNIDGLPAIHLYYKYGGNDISFFDNEDICHLDIENKNLLIYVLNQIDVFELLVNKLLEKNCLDTIEIPDDDENNHLVLYEICKKVIEISKKGDEKLLQRYLLVLNKIYTELLSKDLVFIAIDLNSIDIIKMLISYINLNIA